MKILLVGSYPPPFGGISVHVQMLQRLLEQNGIDCRVLNIDRKALASPNYLHVKNYVDLLMQLITTSRSRLVHLHTNGHNLKSWLMATVCAWLGWGLGCGSILTIHSGMSPQYIAQPGFWHRQLLKLALAPQSLVVCVNEEIRATLVDFGFKREDSMVLPAFLFDEGEDPPLEPKLKHLLAQFDPIITTVAFLRPEYGLEVLMEALSLIKRQFPRFACLVIGSGEGQAALQQCAVEYGVAEQIFWLGDLEHRECLSLIGASQLFVRPTLADGDSISVREAVHLGVPVVASDVGHRPASVSLFRVGDAADLAAKCTNVLENQLLAKPQTLLEPAYNLLSLIGAYDQISHHQTAPIKMWSIKR